jgi:hypothetical protein
MQSAIENTSNSWIELPPQNSEVKSILNSILSLPERLPFLGPSPTQEQRAQYDKRLTEGEKALVREVWRLNPEQRSILAKRAWDFSTEKDAFLRTIQVALNETGHPGAKAVVAAMNILLSVKADKLELPVGSLERKARVEKAVLLLEPLIIHPEVQFGLLRNAFTTVYDQETCTRALRLLEQKKSGRILFFLEGAAEFTDRKECSDRLEQRQYFPLALPNSPTKTVENAIVGVLNNVRRRVAEGNPVGLQFAESTLDYLAYHAPIDLVARTARPLLSLLADERLPWRLRRSCAEALASVLSEEAHQNLFKLLEAPHFSLGFKLAHLWRAGKIDFMRRVHYFLMSKKGRECLDEIKLGAAYTLLSSPTFPDGNERVIEVLQNILEAKTRADSPSADLQMALKDCLNLLAKKV